MGTLICRVELNKTEGLILTVENKDGKITQTAVLDGESITIKSMGQDDTSTIIQKPDSISIKCKTFTLESETITCKSTKDTFLESEKKFDIKSAKEMVLDSKAKLNVNAANDIDVSGNKIGISARGNAELSGMNITVDGKTKTEVKGAMLKLSGSAKADLEGGLTKISSKGMLDLEGGGVATLKGIKVNIQGIVSVG